MDTLTAQSVFDDTVRHLKGMKHRSMDPSVAGTGCAYLSPDGCRCAVGAHLTMEEILLDEVEVTRLGKEIKRRADRPPQLDDLIGGSGVDDLAFHELLPQRLVPHRLMLRQLQILHDDERMWTHDDSGPHLSAMGDALRMIGRQHVPSTAVVDKLFGAAA